MSDASKEKEFEIVIVGAGFSGVYQLYRLREEGFNVRLVEAGAGIGGIWHWNCYPGARVDTHCQIYQFSKKELWNNWSWSERFPGWEEMRRYFDYVDEKLDLSKDVDLNTRVTGAEFNESTNEWSLKTDVGGVYRSKFVVLCTGFASKPYMPDVQGIDTFKGELHHTAAWPQTGIDFTGKRVGVIGTGASGIQVAQEASKVASHVTVFQRTPNLYLPMGQASYSEADNVAMKEELPARFKKRGETFGGFDMDLIAVSGLDVSDEEREETYERLWEAGGFNFWLGSYHDIFSNETVNRTAYDFWLKKTRARITDPVLAEKLAPTEPPHPYGVKRPSLEQWYFDIFNHDNATLVSLKEEPLKKITEAGVETQEASYDFDIIAFATGFDAVTGGLTSINLTGTNGVSLKEKWAIGVRTHLGLATASFPNVLIGYGPQAPTGFCNGPSSAEYQGECIIEMLCHIREKDYARVEADKDAEESWRNQVLELAAGTLFPKADSWYMGANVPGKPKEMLMYPGGLPAYLEAFRNCANDGYQGFNFTK
ncbi:MAG: NAD(P)/FAD-dependent oxidoreductase [Gammaproteobacteria bacterium]|nr:NAD(P)/FAD-dependent oxidoreductase [Gammaproteobacteria bacterium]